MSRVEHIGEAILYLGDCREILPTLSGIDACVTDPPYGIALNTKSNRFTGGITGKKRGRGIGPANGQPLVGDAPGFDPKVCLIGDEQIIWGWNNFPDKLPRGTCLIWVKRNDDAFGSFLSDAETAWFSKGHGVYCFKDISNAGITLERVHPTQKPVNLMTWCVEKTKGETVCDPFMGSGTTGVACAKLGRKFIGIEIDPGYFEIACKRIQKAYDQPDFFVEKPAPIKQQELL